MNRRTFAKRTGGALALAALSPSLFADEASPSRRELKKAIMWGTVALKGSVLENMHAVKEAGFEGGEMNSHMNQDDVLRARDETGLIVPSVCGSLHWEKPL